MSAPKPVDFSKATSEDISYLAGFIDGEGCFYIGYIWHKNRYSAYHYVTVLKISNNDTDTLKWIHEKFGGRIDLQHKKTKSADRNFITYNILFTGNQLTDLTDLLIPYLRNKKPQALIMKEMRATYPRKRRGNMPVDPELMEVRKQCHDKIHRLNSRFKNHPLKQDLYLPPCDPS